MESIARIFVVTLALVVVTGIAQAAVLVEYNFNDSTLNTSATSPLANATLTKDADFKIIGQSNPSFIGPGTNKFLGVNTVWPGQQASQSRKVRVDITAADPGTPLNLSSFTWNGKNAVSEGEGAYDYDAEYSTDGGANWMTLVSGRDTTSTWEVGTPLGTTLTGSDFENVQAISFRIRMWNGVNGKWRGLDDIVIEGSAIPEPATLSLIGLAGLVGLKRRR